MDFEWWGDVKVLPLFLPKFYIVGVKANRFGMASVQDRYEKNLGRDRDKVSPEGIYDRLWCMGYDGDNIPKWVKSNTYAHAMYLAGQDTRKQEKEKS